MALDALEFDKLKPKLGDNFLLLGGDPFLMDTVTDQLRLELKQQEDVDLVIIYGDEVKCAQINDLLDAYSIFSSAKLILFRNADLLKKAELECLAAYFADPSSQQSLVITAQKIDARLSGWKKIREACQTVACDPPRHGGMFAAWLDKALARLGKTMPQNARYVFTNRVELDFASANNELQKLSLLVGERKQITEADVLRGIGSSRVGTQIAFAKALGDRQASEALSLLDRMLASDQKALQITSQINRVYMTIYHILLMKEAHLSPSEISGKYLMEVFADQRRFYLGFAQKYTLSQMEKIFAILLDTDAKLKTTAASDAVLLTSCILRILEAA
ncbi:MAG: DNA polymerase III subunit delta [Candidatus Cloacimonetes bacterium]|nr:DNA polymerase III subunit delta [Candidatus Cloacimonadota bacterium]